MESSDIRDRADELGLSLAEVARRVGVSRQRLWTILSGDLSRVRLETLGRIAHALDARLVCESEDGVWRLEDL